jgi:hypothetical protein
MKLSVDWIHPAEGELLVAALGDQTYAVLRFTGETLFEVQSGEIVHEEEIAAAAVLEEWPWGQIDLFSAGDDVMVEVEMGVLFEQGRVLHTHGSEAWVRLIGGTSRVMQMHRLKPL